MYEAAPLHLATAALRDGYTIKSYPKWCAVKELIGEDPSLQIILSLYPNPDAPESMEGWVAKARSVARELAYCEGSRARCRNELKRVEARWHLVHSIADARGRGAAERLVAEIKDREIRAIAIMLLLPPGSTAQARVRIVDKLAPRRK